MPQIICLMMNDISHVAEITFGPLLRMKKPKTQHWKRSENNYNIIVYFYQNMRKTCISPCLVNCDLIKSLRLAYWKVSALHLEADRTSDLVK